MKDSIIKEKNEMPKNTFQCIICGSNKLKRQKAQIASFLKDRMFNNEPIDTDFLVCKDCACEYFSLRPDETAMKRLYANYMKDEYIASRNKHENFKKYRQDYEENISIELNFRKNNIYKILNKNTDPSKIQNVLDFGGDRGQFIPDELCNASKYVYEISGVEPLEGINSINDMNECKKIKWDLIMCNHVLEHVSAPMEIVSMLTSLLEKDGLFYVELPYDSHYRLENILKRPKVLYRANFNMHEHINFYHPKTLNKMFKNAGFNILFNKIIKTNCLFGQTGIISCLAIKK